MPLGYLFSFGVLHKAARHFSVYTDVRQVYRQTGSFPVAVSVPFRTFAAARMLSGLYS